MNFRAFSVGCLVLGAMAVVHGCSSGDDTATPGAGHGGRNGSGGHAGTAASGGTHEESGNSGAGGNTGSESAGAAEQGGTRSAAGQAGRATASGAGGAKGGGTGHGGTAGSPAIGEGGSTAGASAAGASGDTDMGGAAGDGSNPACVDDLNLPLLDTPPATLDATGLYASASSAPDDVAPYVYPFTPRYPLWSDGAQKRRFIYLPKCTHIDTSDMDHWKFPVGTRFWKEFTFTVGSSPVRVETRFIHHYGPGDDDWLFVAYQWDPNVLSPTAGNTAAVPNGVVDANGTTHDIPSQDQCTFCHAHLPERILGFGAFELTQNPGTVSMASLSHAHLLTVPAPAGFSPPGTSAQQEGLGYLHANCGGCHNAFFTVTPASPSPRMRLLVAETTLEATDTYTTLVNVPTQNAAYTGVDRIEPGDHAHSEIIERMAVRDVLQMPPIATEAVDQEGIATVATFIDSLTP